MEREWRLVSPEELKRGTGKQELAGEREDNQSRKVKEKTKMGKMGRDGLIAEQGIKKHSRRFKKREIIEEEVIKCGNKHICTQGCKASYTSAWFQASSEERVPSSANIRNALCPFCSSTDSCKG